MRKSPVYFLTWVSHRRTQEICSQLDLELVELLTTRKGVFRYAVLAQETLRFLVGRRPRCIIAQTPSLVLGLLLLIGKFFFRYRLVVDAHNETVTPFLYDTRAIRMLSKMLIRSADLIIVTNAPLAAKVVAIGGLPFVLPDPISRQSAADPVPLSGRANVVLISTFASDEPIEEVIQAAKLLPTDVHIHVTGRPSARLAETLASRSANVKLTGFLPEHDYWQLLASSDVVMDLTKMPDCLVCGAYEAASLFKPMVLSSNRASCETFGEFAYFTENSAAEIAAVLQTALKNASHQTESIRLGVQRYSEAWKQKSKELLKRIDSLCPPA